MAVQFPAEETIIGYVDTDSGGLLITDAAWESALPRATHKHTAIDFGDIPSCRIPVYAKLVGGRRFVIIDIDADNFFATAFINNFLDRLAAGSDQFADLVGIDLDRLNARRIR